VDGGEGGGISAGAWLNAGGVPRRRTDGSSMEVGALWVLMVQQSQLNGGGQVGNQ